MDRLLSFLGGAAPRVLFFGIFIGLLVPPLAALCRPLLAPAVLLILLTTLLRVEWPALLGQLRRPAVPALLVAALLLAAPLLVWLAVASFAGHLALPPALVVALVLMAAAPPILSATAITLFLGLDSALAIVASVGATLLVPLTLPPMALALTGIGLQISLEELMVRLVLLVAGAFLGAVLLRRLAGRERLAARAGQIDGAAVL
ncbi:MAG: hypothetical protein ACFCUQ_21875, partial [Kiloniellales bacterium]